jgi:ABC-type multidrug transport system fused ATPase/permease subunit
VTHNADTIQLADRVLFLENGQLAGDGTHDALYRENPQYRALWEEGDQESRAGRRTTAEPSLLT